MELTYEEVDLIPVELSSDPGHARETAARPIRAPPAGLESLSRLLTQRLQLGAPKHWALTAAKLAGHTTLVDFVNSRTDGSRFVVVQLTCSFNDVSEAPFSEAALQVALGREDGSSGEEQPVVWSMAPLAVTHEMAVSNKLSVGPKLKLSDTAEVGVSAGRDVTSKKEELHVFAVGEGTSVAGWKFRATKQRPLAGIYHVAMVVQHPQGVVAKCTLDVEATVKKRRWFWRSDAALDVAPAREFLLG